MSNRVSELRVGNFIRILKENDSNIYRISSIDYSMQGRGSSSYECNMNVVYGPQAGKSNIKKRFSASDRVDVLFAEEKLCSFSYSTENEVIFMDYESMEEIYISKAVIGDQIVLLHDGMEVKIVFCEGNAIFVNLPEKLEVEVLEADPVIKGQTAASSSKSAFIANNIKITVPKFIKSGDKIIISTKDFSYVSRA